MNLKIPAQPRYARLVRDRIRTFAKQHQLDARETGEFVAAVGEALSNAIEHSRADAVQVSWWLDGSDKLLALIADSGRGFPMGTGARGLPGPQAERGRGMPIMQRYADVVKVDSEPGKGTVVVLGRKLHRPA
jgi:anti-sigma regulatory factor (Ser/Thr protein kinase)